MKQYVFLGAFLSSVAIAALVACSSSSTDTTTSQPDASQQKDSSTTDGSTVDSATADGSMNTSPDSGSNGTDSGNTGNTGPTLTIDNYLAWCSVTVNGGTPSTGSLQTYPFEAGTPLMLHGDTANAGAFYWGYWGDVSDAGATDGGMDTNMDISFTITKDTTLHACCPDLGQQLSQCTF